MKLLQLLFATFATLASACGQGFVLWNESVNGPLGGDPATAIYLGSLSAGTNTLLGMTQAEPIGSSWEIYPDYFQLDVPPSLRVSAIIISVDRPNVWSVISPSDFDSVVAFTLNSSSGDLFPQYGITSLDPGRYGMYLANHDVQSFPVTASYRLDFIVTPVPEPSTWALLGLGSVLFWFVGRGSKK